MGTNIHPGSKVKREPDAYEIIKRAIQNKQQIHAVYDGYERLMCPHVIGTKQGVKKCLFYQFAGASLSKHSTGWEVMPVDKLHQVRAVDGDWYSSLIEHNKPDIDTELDNIDAKIDY